MRATLDGEVIVDLEPVFGYLHRGIEKLAEERTYTGIIPMTDRLDYMASMSNNLAYVMAVEKLAGIRVPERAEYMRVIIAEITRIANHLVAVGSFFNDCGAFFTPFLYMFREREKIYDLFEMLSGQRVLYNYMRIGGFTQDMPDEFLPAARKLVGQIEKRLEEYDHMLAENEIAIARSKGVGIISRELATSVGASGPVLRATGLAWDIRKIEPYSIYDRFEFDVPTGNAGDCYDRWRVRVAEMWESVKILKQALKEVPAGPVKTPVSQFFHPPVGEAYGRIEGPKGELGFYIVSDGSIAPYRCHIRAPSLINLTALRDMVIGWKIQDLIIIFGSIDITMGEVDR